jgi:hypothetical protein
MSRGQVLLVHLSNLLVAGTGLVWAVMRYALEPVDEFALQNHPLEDEFQAAHVLAAPLSVLALGIVWAVHAAPHLAAGTRTRRRTGMLLLGCAPAMVASGYLLQVAVEPGWREGFVLVHLVTSLAFLVLLAAHLTRRSTGA